MKKVLEDFNNIISNSELGSIICIDCNSNVEYLKYEKAIKK